MVRRDVRPWFEEDPARYVREKEDVLSTHPSMRFSVCDGTVKIEGPLPIQYDGVEIDQFEIRVECPANYPVQTPRVYETGGKIRVHQDWHMMDSGEACLFARDERWRYFPIETATLVRFIDGPVYQFFLDQAHFERTGEWMFPCRSHGVYGVLEYYFEEFKTSDMQIVLRMLAALANPEIKGHWLCPCGSGKKLRRCHPNLMELHRHRIPCHVAADSLKRGLALVESLRRRTLEQQADHSKLLAGLDDKWRPSLIEDSRLMS